ncbi:hypothetical protein MINTM008_13620 [Mycobacterium intracellulare]|nr:hypothetical protein MINTM002_11170 [Mycobacterium intracellulare]BCO61275.1 hypothetical protein MINTM006_12250 [Mycobacterium intracellulare]BCO66474.1 hypothetical protein MINTM007_10850 [Mycobacterium intracellulare]BCO72027.1 hypothetical protein MINTM008_13620 [Mycobacterium intracellulare]BCO77473.1 hypothetical protein MINTM009_12550 [Mycobacterium intracellulare]
MTVSTVADVKPREFRYLAASCKSRYFANDAVRVMAIMCFLALFYEMPWRTGPLAPTIAHASALVRAEFG